MTEHGPIGPRKPLLPTCQCRTPSKHPLARSACPVSLRPCPNSSADEQGNGQLRLWQESGEPGGPHTGKLPHGPRPLAVAASLLCQLEATSNSRVWPPACYRGLPLPPFSGRFLTAEAAAPTAQLPGGLRGARTALASEGGAQGAMPQPGRPRRFPSGHSREHICSHTSSDANRQGEGERRRRSVGKSGPRTDRASGPRGLSAARALPSLSVGAPYPQILFPSLYDHTCLIRIGTLL